MTSNPVAPSKMMTMPLSSPVHINDPTEFAKSPSDRMLAMDKLFIQDTSLLLKSPITLHSGPAAISHKSLPASQLEHPSMPAEATSPESLELATSTQAQHQASVVPPPQVATLDPPLL